MDRALIQRETTRCKSTNIRLPPSLVICKTWNSNELIGVFDWNSWSKNKHCVKGVQIRSFFWSVFSRIRTEYVDFRRKSSYSVRIRENMDQKKLRIWTLFIQWSYERNYIENRDFVLCNVQTNVCDTCNFEIWYCKIVTNSSVIFQGEFSCYVFQGRGWLWWRARWVAWMMT